MPQSVGSCFPFFEPTNLGRRVEGRIRRSWTCWKPHSKPEGPAPPDPASRRPKEWLSDGITLVAAGKAAGEHTLAGVVSVMARLLRQFRDYADPRSASPDSTLIALGTGRALRRSRESRLMGPQVADPRRLTRGSKVGGSSWAAWLPDGQNIVNTRFRRRPNRLDCSIERGGLKEGEPTLILSGPRRCFGNVEFHRHHGGRFIQTMSPDATYQGRGGIFPPMRFGSAGRTATRALESWSAVM
jgi:hypothetical protein